MIELVYEKVVKLEEEIVSLKQIIAERCMEKPLGTTTNTGKYQNKPSHHFKSTTKPTTETEKSMKLTTGDISKIITSIEKTIPTEELNFSIAKIRPTEHFF